jgi:hypothetical protein
VKRSRGGHHVASIVMFGQASAQEHPPEMNVVGNVTARDLGVRYAH